MLASAGIDGQHEYEPSWAPGSVGRRGGCDRELHADADRRVHACQPEVSRATLQWATFRLDLDQFGEPILRQRQRQTRAAAPRLGTRGAPPSPPPCRALFT